jgi:hypothetical protein
MTAEKRLVRVTAANLKHSHLYVTGLRDFFPPEAFGGARRKNGEGYDVVHSNCSPIPRRYSNVES